MTSYGLTVTGIDVRGKSIGWRREIFRRQADRLAAAITRGEPYESFSLAMLILVSYDIPDDRRRTRLAHTLKDFGERVQYSVFECNLKQEQLDRLRARITTLIESKEDSVRIYRLCAECAERLEIQGLGRPTKDPEVYVL